MLRKGIQIPEEASKSILKSIFKKSIPIVGLYLLSNLAVFVARDYCNRHLTEEQLKMMDQHNETHKRKTEMNSFIMDIVISMGLGSKDTKATEKILKDELDKETSLLPEHLRHKH